MRLPKRRGTIVIGVDIDGVLGDHMTVVAQYAQHHFGVVVQPSEITSYVHQVTNGRHIGHVLVEIMKDRELILSLPVHDGAADMLHALREVGLVKIVTARPAAAESSTREWLARNGLVVDDIVFARRGCKSRCGADILIDDHVRNAQEFVAHKNRRAVVMSRPWNREDPVLHLLQKDGRVSTADVLAEVPAIVRQAYGVRACAELTSRRFSSNRFRA